MDSITNLERWNFAASAGDSAEKFLFMYRPLPHQQFRPKRLLLRRMNLKL